MIFLVNPYIIEPVQKLKHKLITEPKETNEEVSEELTSEELESVYGGIIEFTTTDNQTLVWNVKENTMSYSHENR